jgi:hypothetical protein
VYKKGKRGQSGVYKMVPFDVSATEFEYGSVRLWKIASQHYVQADKAIYVTNPDTNSNKAIYVTNLDTNLDTSLDTSCGHKADTNPDMCHIYGTYINNNNINNNYNKLHESILDNYDLPEEYKEHLRK